MKKNNLYWIIIACGILIIFGANLVSNFTIQTFLYCILTLCIVVIPCIIFVFVLEFMPKKLFDANKKIFHVFKFENKFYEKMKIKKWKEKIPTIKSVKTGFDKTKIISKSPDYLLQFLTENCKAETGHAISILWGLISIIIAIFILPKHMVLTVWLPVVILNTLFHYGPIAIQRYIRPRLLRLYNTSLKENEDELEKRN